MEHCDACKGQPLGIEGHPDLMVQRMSGSHLGFRCRKCGALWTRSIRIGEAEPFRWKGPMQAEAQDTFRMGIAVPCSAQGSSR